MPLTAEGIGDEEADGITLIDEGRGHRTRCLDGSDCDSGVGQLRLGLQYRFRSTTRHVRSFYGQVTPWYCNTKRPVIGAF